MTTTNSSRSLRRLCSAHLLIALLGCTLVVGCANPRKARQARLAQNVVALEIDDARATDDAIYVKYTGAVEQITDIEYREDLYAKAEPVREVDLISQMNFLTPRQWVEAASDGRPITVFSSDVYRDMIDDVVESIAPRDPSQGVSVRSDLDEFVIHRLENGEATISVLDEVIADLELVETLTPDDLRRATLEDLRERLPADAQRAILVTGRSGRASTPFLYADLDEGLVNLLKVETPKTTRGLTAIGVTVDTGIHVVLRSFFLELLRSPVRMFTRSAFGLGYTVGDTTFANRAIGEKSGDPPPLYEGPGMDLGAFNERLDRITRTRTIPGQVVSVLIGGDEYFPVLRQAILQAKESVDIRTYLWDNDDYAVNLADLLRERSNDGVKVRVLVDGLGTIVAATVDSPNMPADFNPPAKMSWYMRRGSKVKFRSQTNPFLMGDHAKSTTIDDERCFVGGMNIAREYRYEWHDVMIEVQGPIVQAIQREFENIWQLASFFGDWQFAVYAFFGKKPRPGDAREGDYPIRMLKTVPGSSQIYKAQLEAIRSAKKYIYIENLYFSNKLFLQELINARQRGVDVRVIMPMQGNWGVLSEGAMTTANKMFAAGIRVYLYPRMTHVKAAVYDGWVCLGSANFDKLSFRINEEINLCYTDEEAVQELVERLFEKDFETAVEMTERLNTNVLNNFAAIISDYL